MLFEAVQQRITLNLQRKAFFTGVDDEESSEMYIFDGKLVHGNGDPFLIIGRQHAQFLFYVNASRKKVLRITLISVFSYRHVLKNGFDFPII